MFCGGADKIETNVTEEHQCQSSSYLRLNLEMYDDTSSLYSELKVVPACTYSYCDTESSAADTKNETSKDEDECNGQKKQKDNDGDDIELTIGED